MIVAPQYLELTRTLEEEEEAEEELQAAEELVRTRVMTLVPPLDLCRVSEASLLEGCPH